MPELDDSFSRLLGHQATDTQRKRLLHVRDALGLRNNDALWLVLIALEHYQQQYERFPEEIREASKRAAAEVIEASATASAGAAKSAAEQAKHELARAVAQAVAAASRGTTRKHLLKWAFATIALVSTVIAGAAWCGYTAAAREIERAEARAAWAESNEGQLAYDLARTGSLRVLARCEGPGWEVRGGKCYPQPYDGKTVFGWSIPSGRTLPENLDRHSRKAR